MRSAALPLCLLVALAGSARAADETATLTGVTPQQAARLFRALQSPGLGSAKRGGASVAARWTVEAVEVDATGWLVRGQLQARFKAFQHRQSSLLSNVISVFSGTRAKKVDFDYLRAVSVEFDAASGLLGIRMHDTGVHVGQYNIAIEGTTSSKVELPSVAVSGGPFRVQGHVEGKQYRAYATGLPYTLLPVLSIERYGFGRRKRLRMQFGLRWKSNVELEVKSHGSASDGKAEASIDVRVGGESVLTGAIASTSQRLETPISVKATGQGLLASVVFDEAVSQRSSGLRLGLAMDVSWELAILQHAAVTNFGSVHVEAKRPLPLSLRSKPIPGEMAATWKAAATHAERGLPLPGPSAALSPPQRPSVMGADVDAIRHLYRHVPVRKERPELKRKGAIGALNESQ